MGMAINSKAYEGRSSTTRGGYPKRGGRVGMTLHGRDRDASSHVHGVEMKKVEGFGLVEHGGLRNFCESNKVF